MLLSIAAFGAIVKASRSRAAETDAPLPRPKRRRRRARADRGLPPDEQLRSLANDYLVRQRSNWPEIAQSGLLPDPGKQVLEEMVEDFKRRHRGAPVLPQAIEVFFKYCSKLGGSYNRFSCESSSPTSINDQLVNSMDKASAEKVFVPWAFIFADYSVSGLDSSRQGYTSYKHVLRVHDRLGCTFIDDFTRASRDEIEWWRLAAFHKRFKKGMLGASDNFDLDSPDWDIKVTIAALVSRLFIRGLQQKVKRGMKGSARRGTVIGKLSLGFTRQVLRDDNGQIVLRANGLPKHVPVIDPGTVQFRREMFDMFVDDNASVPTIRKQFNKQKVDGWNGWTDTAVRDLLWST